MLPKHSNKNFFFHAMIWLIQQFFHQNHEMRNKLIYWIKLNKIFLLSLTNECSCSQQFSSTVSSTLFSAKDAKRKNFLNVSFFPSYLFEEISIEIEKQTEFFTVLWIINSLYWQTSKNQISSVRLSCRLCNFQNTFYDSTNKCCHLM